MVDFPLKPQKTDVAAIAHPQICSVATKGGNLTAIFADDPAAWTEGDAHWAHHLQPAQVEALQLAAVNARFASLRDKLPPLAALADAQGIVDISSLDAGVYLLFPHGIYKSYPEQCLIEGDYAAMTLWLSRLTVHDLTGVQQRSFSAMDDWLDALDNETPLCLYHSSGTSGRLSFHPRAKADEAVVRDCIGMTLAENYQPERFAFGEWHFAFYWPSHAFGRTAALRTGHILAGLVCAQRDDFHPLLPTVLSSDYHYHVLRTQNMAAQGFVFGPVASDYVLARIEEAEALRRFVPERLNQFADSIAALKGEKRVMIAGGPVNIQSIISAGLARSNNSRPAMHGSIVYSFGGHKGAPETRSLETDAKRYLGNPLLCEAYGMTEISGALNKCEAGRFHVPPWIVPYVLDVISGSPLPREGRQSGRGAFMDLLPQSHWGGVITADYVEIDWQTCPCGRQSAHMGPEVRRIAENAGDGRMIGPAAQTALYSALEALTKGLPRTQ